MSKPLRARVQLQAIRPSRKSNPCRVSTRHQTPLIPQPLQRRSI
nr:MAG TPA: hypothetical protein [Caudoviricetes sp.]